MYFIGLFLLLCNIILFYQEQKQKQTFCVIWRLTFTAFVVRNIDKFER